MRSRSRFEDAIELASQNFDDAQAERLRVAGTREETDAIILNGQFHNVRFPFAEAHPHLAPAAAREGMLEGIRHQLVQDQTAGDREVHR
jgi:hypothetical protein